MLVLRLPEEIEKRLEALASKTGGIRSFYVREAIMEHLEGLEDYYIAIYRMENPSERIWSLEELE